MNQNSIGKTKAEGNNFKYKINRIIYVINLLFGKIITREFRLPKSSGTNHYRASLLWHGWRTANSTQKQGFNEMVQSPGNKFQRLIVEILRKAYSTFIPNALTFFQTLGTTAAG